MANEQPKSLKLRFLLLIGWLKEKDTGDHPAPLLVEVR
jgi:hypothetical protein